MASFLNLFIFAVSIQTDSCALMYSAQLDMIACILFKLFNHKTSLFFLRKVQTEQKKDSTATIIHNTCSSTSPFSSTRPMIRSYEHSLLS